CGRTTSGLPARWCRDRSPTGWRGRSRRTPRRWTPDRRWTPSRPPGPRRPPDRVPRAVAVRRRRSPLAPAGRRHGEFTIRRVLVLADSLAFHGPERAELLTHPSLYPNAMARALGED